ncbi:MAG TPA: 6-phosphogluconolactonase [Homoserinimonas sp.]|nr:6-phosphogluconolactonase [Homoserinimonas sp.]
MTMGKRVLVHQDSNELMTVVGGRVIRTAGRTLGNKQSMNIVLTGGSVGIGILGAISVADNRGDVDWSRVHFWWGDERWVPAGHEDRNEQQAKDALLDALAIPEENLHPFPASDDGLDLDAAAERYAEELASAAEGDSPLPHFDILLLGVGPDGHIASLFPERRDLVDAPGTVVAVRNSPKPPPERLSLTLKAINSAERVWIALAGADKASALGLALAGAGRYQVPVGAVEGRRKTVFFVDEAAAAEVPAELIASQY